MKLNEAIEEVVSHFREHGLDKPYWNGNVRRSTNIRLDFELAEGPDLERVDPVDVLPLFLKPDLEDLLENGDVAGTDPLLKALDGSVKRGQSLKHVEFPRVTIFSDLKERKSTTEYTVFLVVYAEWEQVEIPVRTGTVNRLLPV